MCSRSITLVLSKTPGVYSVSVNLVGETADVIFNPNIVTIEELGNKINNIGFEYLGVKDLHNKNNKKIQEAHEKSLKSKRNRIFIGFLFSIPTMLLMFSGINLPIPMSLFMLIITIIPFIYVTYPIFNSSYHALRVKNLNMDVMYALGIGVAFVSSVMGTFHIILTPDFMFYDTSLMLAAFLMLGKYLEDKAKSNTSEAVNKLADLQVKEATVEKTINGKVIEQKENIESIIKGNIIIVKPGEKIPLDGEIIYGKSHIDESFVTGESIPVQKTIGDNVVGGSINKDGVLKFKVTNTSEYTVLSQIIQLVQDAQSSHPPIQKLADKIVKYFIPTLLIIAFLAFIIWYVILGSSLLFSLTVLISVLVVACPCSLGLATPTAVTVGIGRAAEFGILIKDGQTLEVSENIDTVLLDKTGTITIGHPVLTDVINYSNKKDDELLRIIGSIEQYSQHPIATAILEDIEKRQINLDNINDFKVYDGEGIKATLDKTIYYIGNKKLMKNNKINITDNIESDLHKQESLMKTTVIISSEKEILGLVSVADAIKTNSKSAIDKFHEMNIKTKMITGDNKLTSEKVAKKVGITEVISDVMPQDKLDNVKKLQTENHHVVFIGDGINDAPALAQSDVGIAIGGGTDIARESGDIVLVNGDITDAVGSIQIAKKVMKRIHQNLFWAFAYNIILIPIAAGILTPWNILFRPEYSAFAMALSSVTVVTLSLLLKNYTPDIYKKEDNE